MRNAAVNFIIKNRVAVDMDFSMMASVCSTVLSMVERIREERAFAGPEDLAARIGEDVEEARRILENRES